MFDELIVSGHTGEMARTHKPWSVGVSMILEAGILGALLLIPLIYTETMPAGVLNTFLVAPPWRASPCSRRASDSGTVRRRRAVRRARELSISGTPVRP